MASPYSQIPVKATKQPAPFQISISEEKLSDFEALLKLSKVTAPTYESLQEDRRFGVGHKWITDAKKYWEEDFDWRKREKHMNSFPHFITNVALEKEEYKIHFVSLFSEKPDAIPLVLLHGWPGSFLEFLPILSLMKDKYTPQKLPYHIVVPSLPGYGFSSSPPLDRDFSMNDIGALMNQLMIDLGFGEGYIAQGGDIGSRVAKILAWDYEACKAIHVNYFSVLSPPEGMSVSSLTEKEQEGLKRGEDFVTKGSGYSLEHATRPSTIGLVLGSSPVALLAWIGEKFLVWSDEDPDLDKILESVTLYWLTETFPTSIYPYRARFIPGFNIPRFVEKPLGYSYFPKEITPTPQSWVKTQANVVFYREHEKGGHFAALEQPELLMGDIEQFIAQVWK
ncbi:alpha/beta-hydrolase [Hyaloscypha variabilis F]|uniref:Alpha/beta-hydrolase n=1 Tax=Hyaloscypha variabilis (strain UAMH 11265 / GT02V1 / F) TaxID=1149755 RepID=A0A2J6RU64_HYAVF|nr:alpha/beta-hydrolase [Hyaloscypha variabilis F]